MIAETDPAGVAMLYGRCVDDGAASSMVTAGLAQWAPAATTRPASDWVVIVPDADAGNRWAEITDVADRHVATSTA
ncbi:MAG TPA: hypothetical protein VIM10_18300 [Actinopolymorphaceae bacterium]